MKVLEARRNTRVWDRNWNYIGAADWKIHSDVIDISDNPALRQRIIDEIEAGRNVMVSIETEMGRWAGHVISLDDRTDGTVLRL